MAYDDISQNLKRAVLTAEDSAFFDHDGLDYDELKKSMEMWKQGDFSRGASTITQQLAKNLYLSPSRNPSAQVPRAADHAAARGRADRSAASSSCT